MKKVSRDVNETKKIAESFLNKILKKKKQAQGALVVGLSGDLGAGKTVFVQAVGKHLGIKNKITSPTFVIMKKYPIGKTYGVKFLFHFDAYRLKNEKELLHLGWEEIINNKEHLVFIEWPENVSGAMPPDASFVYISHGKDGSRNLES